MHALFKKILDFNADRIEPYTAYKLLCMSQNTFRFFRGTAHLFYEDLQTHISWKDSTQSWICGDLHLENFGSYKGTNGIVYFDLNDFDEALLAPTSWEMVRLLTSVYVAAQSREYAPRYADKLCNRIIDTYLETLKGGKQVVIEKESATGLLKAFLKQVQLRKQKEFVARYTIIKKKKTKLRLDNIKLFAVDKKKGAQVMQHVDAWLKKNYPDKKTTIVDIAFRVAGTGSLGLERYALLAEFEERHFLLDMKEARASSLVPYVKVRQPKWENEAQRVATLQNHIQQVTPDMLNYMTMGNSSFVLKVLQPMQDRIEFAACDNDLTKLSDIVATMGKLSASAQLRCTGREKSSITDQLIFWANDKDKWLPEMKNYAKKYAAKVKSDYEIYCKDYLLYAQKHKAALKQFVPIAKRH